METNVRKNKRSKQLLYDIKEMGRYWKWEEETLDRNLWRNRFGRGYGLVARQDMEWINIVNERIVHILYIARI